MKLEIIDNVCPYCKNHFYVNKKVFANHIRWCKYSPNYEQRKNNFKEKLSNKLKENSNNKERKLNCVICGKEYTIICTDDSFNKGKYKRTCCDKCAKKLTVLNTNKKNKNIKISLSNKKEPYKKQCPYCHNIFETKKKNQIYCSNSCSRKYRSLTNYVNSDKENINLYQLYRNNCAFKFSLNEFPDEFDFNLIKENGWYKAKNHGNNLKGVSRDHIYSCKEGYDNLIDPYIISHPANCQLLLQSSNASKHDKSNVNINDLIEKIKIWNKKYGVYPNKINYDIFELLNIKFYGNKFNL